MGMGVWFNRCWGIDGGLFKGGCEFDGNGDCLKAVVGL